MSGEADAGRRKPTHFTLDDIKREAEFGKKKEAISREIERYIERRRKCGPLCLLYAANNNSNERCRPFIRREGRKGQFAPSSRGRAHLFGRAAPLKAAQFNAVLAICLCPLLTMTSGARVGVTDGNPAKNLSLALLLLFFLFLSLPVLVEPAICTQGETVTKWAREHGEILTGARIDKFRWNREGRLIVPAR